ncbi:MAG: hypothetical protein CMP76_06710 [Flavobacterium sp.]|nr:hypothetical protein [Flavobacterium sp.]|tara:strand:+ start:1211 stop:1702 length:492 start_codon:yes stop_codon:yes gene_type:complete
MVLILELGFISKLIPNAVYHSSPLFYIPFFSYFFQSQISMNKKLVANFGIIFLISSFVFFSLEGFDKYSVLAGTSMSIAYIVYCLLWFLSQVINPDQYSLLKKQTFWISCSLIIWSVFFIFRSIPMYWLNIHDYAFLIQINIGFQIITIFSYLLFLKGLFCKI